MKMACLSADNIPVSLYKSSVRNSDEDTASTSCDASDFSSRLEVDDDDDEVLSVGCESPPPITSTSAEPDPQIPTLKFSIDNILRPEFGGVQGKWTNVAKKTKCAPIDLSKETKSETTASANSSSDSQQPMLWPAWVYCTRYSDRPSSGKSIASVTFIILI